MVVLKPGSRTQAQHIDNLSVTTLYLQNSAGVLTEVTATADSLNAIGERLKVANKTGGSLAAGTLVYISGYDATLAAPEVTEADADYVTKAAQFVLPAAIANGATGYAEASYTITGLNTSGASAVDTAVLVNIPLPFTPTKFTATVTTTAGALKAITDQITIGANPARIVITGAGGTHLIAGDIVTVLAME